MTLTAEALPPTRKRVPRDLKPRFKPKVSHQLDVVRGTPELAVAEDHLARQVLMLVEELDTKAIEDRYSSQGRRGYHPRQVLGVLIYGSLIGLHETTKLAAALKTDAALLLLSGGYAISAGTLRRFRSANKEFFASAIEQSVELARQRGLLHGDELAIDSVRLRAHASTNAVRTLVRSRKRLAELLAVEVAALSDADRATHEEKLKKHRDAVERCEAEGRTNFVVTNTGAGLLKFPDGSSAPGHRVTVAAAGKRERLVVAVLIDADGHDFGKTEPILHKIRALFERLGITDQRLQAALDAGYWSEKDLRFAAENRDWVDLLIAERRDGDPAFFGHDKFTVRDDGSVFCPADRLMRGPHSEGQGRGKKYMGVGCNACQLKPQCTTAEVRTLILREGFDAVRRQMQDRMAEPDAKARYNQRIATVEPVFSNLESAMKYRRVTTRHERGMQSEILLKILAHNVSRLIEARRLLRVYVLLDVF